MRNINEVPSHIQLYYQTIIAAQRLKAQDAGVDTQLCFSETLMLFLMDLMTFTRPVSAGKKKAFLFTATESVKNEIADRIGVPENRIDDFIATAEKLNLLTLREGDTNVFVVNQFIVAVGNGADVSAVKVTCGNVSGEITINAIIEKEDEDGTIRRMRVRDMSTTVMVKPQGIGVMHNLFDDSETVIDEHGREIG